MSESPVPETLESIAARIEALAKSNDERFGKVDQQFSGITARFADLKAHLSMKIEALDTKVVQVYDEVIAMREEARRNAAAHKTFTKRLENHDLRILALEKSRTPTP